jgi:hypothetical protein
MIKAIPGRDNNKVFIQIEGLDKSVKKEIHNALHEIGRDNVVHCKHLIFARKTGRIYVINGAFHQASAPFEPPANLSGGLVRHLDYKVSGHHQMEFGDKPQQGKGPIGLFLEGGTVKMKKRPHIIKTVRDKYKDTENSLIGSMKKALK